MAMMAVWLKIDEERIAHTFQEARTKLNDAEGDVVLDFSSVRRMDASGIMAMEEFADAADDKGVKIALRGVNIAVYKVLKLVKLASRFSSAK